MAAQDIGVAYVHVEPSGKGFGKSIEGDIGDAVSKASRKGSNTLISKIGGAFGKIGKVGTGAIATIAGGITALAAKGGFTRALNIENAQAKLKGLGHDSASVTEIMNDALASVKGTAFGLGDAATVAASLSASGVKEGGELTKVLKTARGKLQGDDMLQLMSSGIPVLQMLGKHLNKTSAEVSDMVSDGKIDFRTFADAMQEGLGGAALSAGTTFTGALANVKAALSRLGETAATPVLNGLRGLFNQAIPLIDAFTAAVSPTLEKVCAGLQKGLEQAIPTVTAFFDKLGKSQTVQQFASYLASLKDDLKELGSSLSGATGAVWNVISTIRRKDNCPQSLTDSKHSCMPCQVFSTTWRRMPTASSRWPRESPRSSSPAKASARYQPASKHCQPHWTASAEAPLESPPAASPRTHSSSSSQASPRSWPH